ncbi:MAG: InlB B-repeat-containing protein [Clostridia bacterium]|nr:InlB B-repeat-containing protein [Clostridia bacterium]
MKRIVFSLALYIMLLCSCEAAPQEVTTYTVTLDYDYLARVETQTIASGGYVSKPEEPALIIGHNNVGWFIEENGVERAWDFNLDMVESDITLKYCREPKSYELTLYINDGTDEKLTFPVTYGEEYTLPVPEREGYDFLGWFWGMNRDADSGIWQTDGAYELEARWAVFPVGTTISFGHYEQDNNSANGTEPIEWLVLDKNADGSAYFLVSRYVLELLSQNDFNQYAEWKNSALRTWLNGTFYEFAFDDSERGNIRLTTLNDVKTDDYIFALCADDLYRLQAKENCPGLMTDYVRARVKENTRIGNAYGVESVNYWLRMAGNVNNKYAATTGLGLNMERADAYNGVRPAMWVDAAYVEALLEK